MMQIAPAGSTVCGMSRPLRIEFPGALYHITARGDGREEIYRDDRDRYAFLQLLGEACGTCRWCCHGYCLMSNHYHLVVETPEANLTAGMRNLNGSYAQRFNRRHRRVGHVFQGRYGAVIVQKESHLLELARYVVLNPVRAGMVRSAKQWRWSSYRATCGIEEPPRWLHTDWLLASFASKRDAAIDAYRDFVSEGSRASSPWEELKQQIFLGDDSFVQATQARIDLAAIDNEVPLPQRRPARKALSEYATAAEDRDSAIVAAYTHGHYSMRAIGDYFDLDPSRVSQIVGAAGSGLKP